MKQVVDYWKQNHVYSNNSCSYVLRTGKNKGKKCSLPKTTLNTCKKHANLSKQIMIKTYMDHNDYKNLLLNFLASYSSYIDIPEDCYNREDETDCEQFGCDYICRCLRITVSDIHLTSNARWNIYQQLKSIWNQMYKLDDLSTYYADRILSILCRNLKDDDIEADIQHGYYGDEFNGFKIIFDTSLLQGPVTISKILEGEYGYCDKEYVPVSIEKVSTNQINVHNIRHLNNADTQMYADYDGISCVVKKLGTKYSLIDGYHRLAAAKKTGIDIKVLVVQEDLELSDYVSSSESEIDSDNEDIFVNKTKSKIKKYRSIGTQTD